MKLESLNNSKYSLTPEKMGQLVGGEQVKVCTGPCTLNGAKCTCDMYVYADQRDYNHDLPRITQHYTGDSDYQVRSKDWNLACGCAIVK